MQRAHNIGPSEVRRMRSRPSRGLLQGTRSPQSRLRRGDRAPRRFNMARVVIRVARQATIIVLFTVAALLGSAGGILFVFAGDLPQITALDDYAPSTITRD